MVEGRLLRESYKVELTDGGETSLHSHAGGGGDINHTPLVNELTLPTFATWTTITVSNCPADSTAEILISNRTVGAEKYGGVRPVGSSLERKFQIQECEAGGESAVTMLVKVDASQQIQYYAEDNYIHIFVIGYLA